MINGKRYSLVVHIRPEVRAQVLQRKHHRPLLQRPQFKELKLFNYHLASPFQQVEDDHLHRKVQVRYM